MTLKEVQQIIGIRPWQVRSKKAILLSSALHCPECEYRTAFTNDIERMIQHGEPLVCYVEYSNIETNKCRIVHLQSDGWQMDWHWRLNEARLRHIKWADFNLDMELMI